MTRRVTEDNYPTAGGETSRRLYVYNSGFFTQSRIKRILALSGWQTALGQPSPEDWIGVWGDAPSARRGTKIAEARDTPVLRVEDAFLRSLHPGRVGHEPPLGLLLDRTGVHFEAGRPSDLETLLSSDPLDDTALLDVARDCMARIRRSRLSKYSAYDPDLAVPEPGYVLVIDQAEGDASVRASVPGDDMARARFAEMLFYAQTEHPNACILIRSHPETRAGKRGGHFITDQAQGRVSFVDGAFAPVDLLEGAIAVYTLSSHMGFEAILSGHRPRVFGTPFYAGWGLSEDEYDFPRRRRALTRAQLFAGAMLLYPVWYDPYEDRLCDLPRVIDALDALQRAWIEDRHGWTGDGIRLWKRPHMQAMFGRVKPMRFGSSATDGRREMRWGRAERHYVGVEDGFLRSQGLGARLVPPLSLALDDLGMYYDPSRPSRLETLIAQSPALSDDETARARRLIDRIVREDVGKYASGGEVALPDGNGRPLILVPGQVEDDASVLLGAPGLGNDELLARTRAANPGAVILYKPHPDVAAGLRKGAIDAEGWADHVLPDGPMAPLLKQVDAVWTLTSLTGFEALLRDVPVTTLGTPFYAGWGLTTDLGDVPSRRDIRVSVEALAHAALIAYPRYHDPRSGLPCPVEVALDRLIADDAPRSRRLRALSKLQGLMASYTWLWRR